MTMKNVNQVTLKKSSKLDLSAFCFFLCQLDCKFIKPLGISPTEKIS